MSTAVGLDEPLADSAPLARALASTLCAGCAWYHGTWQYLRLLGLAADPARHRPFFAEALGSLARDGCHPAVLVTGTADYSMPAHVAAAYGQVAGALDLAVVDRCATPVVLSGWYAGLRAMPLHTFVSDVLDLARPASFDVVCTHSFLSQFPTPVRPALVARWRHLLRPGGTAVTTTRVSPPGTPGVARFTPAQADAFAERARAEAGRLAPRLDLEPDAVAERARRYAENIAVHTVTSADEVVRLLEDGGLRVEHLEVREVEGPATTGIWGPSTSQSARYAEVVARRA
ncbi:MAG TPA: class I SAM-dependent methyltransferase [Acidimicrobiales bacterium]|nr:class I SAM-dependent methyltransferase [Acidimicrobiales bacterium]